MIYVSYRRVSTRRQGESGLGLESQQDIIEAFYPDIAEDFIEIESGKKASNRPVLQEAIAYCLKHKATLVVAKVDRLARNTVEGLQIMDMLEDRVRFCDNPGEPERFMLTLHFAFAEREAKLISIRTKGALKRAKANGKKLGASRENAKVWSRQAQIAGALARHEGAIHNENNIRAAKVAHLLRDQKQPYDRIAAYLNENKFATPSGTGKWNNGTVWRLVNI